MGFDLRKPRLMKALGLSNLMGITDYLISNDLSAESLIVPLKGVEDLYLIGAGTLPPNPAELMMSVKVKQLMDELRGQFDYIIVDSPPVGRVADVFTLVPYIDSTLYIVRYNYTTKTQLTILKDIHQNKKLKNLSVVLNDAKQHNGNAYAYGYGNGVHKKKRFFQKSVLEK